MIRVGSRERYAPVVSETIPIALCLHRLADGSTHVDLLVARPGAQRGDDDRTVRAWRCAERPDALAPGATLALEPLPDHRGLYLRLAVARVLDRERGTVVPLRGGEASADADRLAVRWRDGGCSLWRIIDDVPEPRLLVEDPAAIPDASFPRVSDA
jgi:hypothetical protein